MPPLPKPAALRQRRNKVAGRAALQSEESSADNEVPPLPNRPPDSDPWHPMVLRWWAGIWRSPMASEYLEADMLGGLYLLADLHHIRWCVRGSAAALKEVAAEIRLQEVRFGLSPIDRRRLQWEVERGETAAEKVEARKAKAPPKKAGKDPRAGLRIAS